LLNTWDDSLPKLVIVGARGKYPNFVIPVNEYYPYQKLLFLMNKARFIIDLPGNCDYNSSFLHLASEIGKTVVSTNWCILDKENGIFVVRNQTTNDVLVPSSEVLRMAITKALSLDQRHKDMSKYNDEFASDMRRLLN